MQLIEWLLLALLVVLAPAWEFWRGPAERARLQADPSGKVSAYRTTCIQLWLPTLALLALYWTGGLSVAQLTVRGAPQIGQLLAPTALVLLALYLAMSLRSVARDPAIRRQTADALQPLAWMLPANRREAIWFIGPVSLTAGICEELLYRGFLMQWLDGVMPIWAAMILSSVVFGLQHAYQGLAGITRTTALGLLLAGVFVASGSLLWPIILHVIIDAYAGALSWLARREEIVPAGGLEAERRHA